jgi:anti-sigma factor RsiW
MGGMIDLSDELLMAYVDGQLDKPQADVVNRLLRDDRDLAFRVSRLQQTQAQLLDTFGALLREGMSTGRTAAKAGRPRGVGAASGRGLISIGTAGLMLLIGASVGFTGAYYSGLSAGGEKEAVRLPPANWPEDIAEFHAFFTKEAMRVSLESQSNPDMVKFQLAQLSKTAAVPDFSGQGLKFVRGQMLSYHGNKVMQLLYLGKSEPLVALYIGVGGLDMSMSPGRFGDVSTISWSANELRYVLASDMQHQELKVLAAVAQSQLNRK